MELKRVVVTGFGAITPIGNNAKEYWENLVKGESGAAPITLLMPQTFKTKFVYEVKKISIRYSISIRKRLKMDRNTQLGLVAAREAVAHSGIIEDNVDKNRVGVIWGSGIGGLETLKLKC